MTPEGTQIIKEIVVYSHPPPFLPLYTPSPVSLISSGYIISMNPSSLMGGVPLFVPWRCFCYDLCFIQILVTQKLVFD